MHGLLRNGVLPLNLSWLIRVADRLVGFENILKYHVIVGTGAHCILLGGTIPTPALGHVPSTITISHFLDISDLGFAALATPHQAHGQLLGFAKRPSTLLSRQAMPWNILPLAPFVWHKGAVLQLFLGLDLVIDGPHFFLEFGVAVQPLYQC